MKTLILFSSLFCCVLRAQDLSQNPAWVGQQYAASAPSGYALVQYTWRPGGATYAPLSFTNSVTSGNFIVVVETEINGQTKQSSASDNLGNTYSFVAYTNSSAYGDSASILYAPATTGGSCTITLPSGNYWSTVVAFEISGGLTTAGAHKESVIAADGASHTNSVTTTGIGIFVAAIAGQSTAYPYINGATDFAKTVSFGGGYSSSRLYINSGSGYTAGTYYNTVSMGYGSQEYSWVTASFQ